MNAPMLPPVDDDDGYVSPEFDLPPASSEDEEEAPPPSKRSKHYKVSPASPREDISTLEDEEELALRMLRGGR